MSEEDIASVRRLFEEAFNGGNLAVIDELVHPEIVDHNPFPNQPSGREGFRSLVTLLRTAFPDLQIKLEDVFSAGDKVCVRERMAGTHQGDFMGLAPTNRRVDVMGIEIMRLEDGRLVEHWAIFEEMLMAMQLGMVPGQGTA